MNDITWEADDPAVLSVDANSGRTTAEAPGQTLVAPIGEKYGRVGGVVVTVHPAAD